MFKRKAPPAASTEKVVQQARNFEVTLVEMSRKSERRAWWVAGGSTAMSVLLAAGYLFVMPLKQQVPYLVLADPSRGTSTIARLEGLSPAYTANDFINKSNAANFVIARESFEWDISPRRDRRMVYSMAVFNDKNPDSPVKVYGPNSSLRVKILSTVLEGNTPDRPPHTAIVRFERWVFNRNTAQSNYLDTRIATMKIGYDSNLQMNEEGRYMNPLGFRVHAYRTDPDAFGTANSQAVAPVAQAPAVPRTEPPAPSLVTDEGIPPLPANPAASGPHQQGTP